MDLLATEEAHLPSHNPLKTGQDSNLCALVLCLHIHSHNPLKTGQDSNRRFKTVSPNGISHNPLKTGQDSNTTPTRKCSTINCHNPLKTGQDSNSGNSNYLKIGILYSCFAEKQVRDTRKTKKTAIYLSKGFWNRIEHITNKRVAESRRKVFLKPPKAGVFQYFPFFSAKMRFRPEKSFQVFL